MSGTHGLIPHQAVYYIYTLSDPRDGLARYIGMSKQPQRRFTAHIRCADANNKEKNAWIQELHRSLLEPVLTIIDWTSHLELARQYEEYWIGVYKKANAPLTNMETLDLYYRAMKRTYGADLNDTWEEWVHE